MNRKKQICWFLTNRQLVNYLLFLFGTVALNVLNIFITLKFLSIQKQVQNGNVVSNWQSFLGFGLAMIILASVITIYEVWYGMTMSVYLKVNLFRRYRKAFQIYEKGVKMKMNLISGILGSIDTVISIFLTGFLVVKTATMIELSSSIIICAGILLASAVLFGILRGLKRASITDQSATIEVREADLTKFYTFSKDYLENALTVLGIEYKSRIKDNLKTNFLGELPKIVKQILVVISVYGFINTMAEGEVYSSMYIVSTAFGTILTLSSLVSSVFEDLFACIKLSKNPKIKELNSFEEKEKFVLEEVKKSFSYDSDTLTIHKNFTANVNGTDSVRYYALKNELHISTGHNILLVGSKGTGKTRFLQIIESLYEGSTMIYNDRTKVANTFFDNFKSEVGWNYDLIQKLANGLKLTRLMLPENELKKLEIKNINTGDMHLLVALIMLYYAISRPELARIIIFDELFANIDKENAEEILSFIATTCKELNTSAIFVGHSQQDMLLKHCDSKWNMKVSGQLITVEES